MRNQILIAFIIVLSYGCQSKNLLIEENGFKGHWLKKTTLSAIKYKHPFVKREKNFRSIMWRTEEGRVCETIYTQSFTLKSRGIKLTFIYSNEDKKREKTLQKIEFYKGAYYLKNGIKLNKSTLSEIDSLYTKVTIIKEEKSISKETSNVKFISFYSDNKDSLEANMVINKIELK